MKLKFTLEEKTRANKCYLFVNYEGGDADTNHPEEILLPFPYSEVNDHLDEIEAMVKKYSILKEYLAYDGDNSEAYEEILSEHGEELASMYENVPNDPQGDYQFKCSLDSVEVIGYDEAGNKWQAYTRL